MLMHTGKTSFFKKIFEYIGIGTTLYVFKKMKDFAEESLYDPTFHNYPGHYTKPGLLYSFYNYMYKKRKIQHIHHHNQYLKMDSVNYVDRIKKEKI